MQVRVEMNILQHATVSKHEKVQVRGLQSQGKKQKHQEQHKDKQVSKETRSTDTTRHDNVDGIGSVPC